MRLQLRRIRKDRKISLRDISKKIKVTPNTIYRWEAGEFFPRPENLQKLSQVLGVSIKDLIEESEDLNEGGEK